MYFEFGKREVRIAASECRVELMEVVMRIFGSGGGGASPSSSVDGKRVGNFAASAAGARERFVEVVERVGELDLCGWFWERVLLDFSCALDGRGSSSASTSLSDGEPSSSPSFCASESDSGSSIESLSSSSLSSSPACSSSISSSSKSCSSASFRLFSLSTSYTFPNPPSSGSWSISSYTRFLSSVAGTFFRSLSAFNFGFFASSFLRPNRSARFSASRARFCFRCSSCRRCLLEVLNGRAALSDSLSGREGILGEDSPAVGNQLESLRRELYK